MSIFVKLSHHNIKPLDPNHLTVVHNAAISQAGADIVRSLLHYSEASQHVGKITVSVNTLQLLNIFNKLSPTIEDLCHEWFSYAPSAPCNLVCFHKVHIWFFESRHNFGALQISLLFQKENNRKYI